MNDRKVLVITRHYLDDNNGGANATKGFLWSFSCLYNDVALIYPERNDRDTSAIAPPAFRLFPCKDFRSQLRKGLDVYRGRLHRFVDFVTDHLKEHRYDIVVLDHTITAACTLDAVLRSGAKVVTIHHNVEKNYIKDNPTPLFYRLPYDYFALKAESDALLKGNVNLTLTQSDADTFQALHQGHNLHLHNVGICEYRPIVPKNFGSGAASKRVFVMTGSLCFRQSVVPIMDFFRRYYPILMAEVPDVRVVVAGRNPNHELTEMCATLENVTLIPNPEDLEKVVANADSYICPVNAGSGIKLRVLDGLKQGLPVLCHEVSAVGYEDLNEHGCLYTYRDEDSFRSALRQLLNNDVAPGEVYKLFSEFFSLSSGVKRLGKALADEKLL